MKLVSIILLLASALQTYGSILQDLRVGQWLEVKGRHTVDGTFEAQEIVVGQPDDEAAITGMVKLDGAGNLMLFRHTLDLEDDVELVGITLDQLPNKRVKAQGELTDAWLFSVEEISLRGRGRDRIEGPIESIRHYDSTSVVSILGYSIVISGKTQLDTADGDPLHAFELSHSTHLFQGNMEDDDDRFGDGWKLADSLRLTSRVVGESAWEDNFNFDDGDNEDLNDLELSIRTRLEWRPRIPWSGTLELRYSARHRERQDRRNNDESKLELGEAFLAHEFYEDSIVVIGRQDFDDAREWLFDENLDGIRLVNQLLGFEIDASYSKIFSADGSREEEAKNIIFVVSRTIQEYRLGAYFIQRDFDQAHNEKTYHYGLRGEGELFSAHNFWIELARQAGDRNNLSVSGWALDLGGTWYLDDARNWYASAGYAFATGDDSSTGRDETFRQTGLQDNTGKLGGITSFRYYGELSDPELSNLQIFTLGVGRRFTRQMSVDLVVHQYRLQELTNRLADVEWDSDLTGFDRDLGWEADVIFGYRDQRFWEIEGVFGYFRPGDGFEDANSSWFGKLQIKLRY